MGKSQALHGEAVPSALLEDEPNLTPQLASERSTELVEDTESQPPPPPASPAFSSVRLSDHVAKKPRVGDLTPRPTPGPEDPPASSLLDPSTVALGGGAFHLVKRTDTPASELHT